MDRVTRDVKSTEIRSVGILGAGTMGRGIAMANAQSGFAVKIFDVDTSAAEETVRRVVNERQTSVIPRPHFSGGQQAPVTVASTEAELADSDLIIEAVPENADLKKAVLEKLDTHLPEGAIVASNSSSLPITGLSFVLSDPSRMCGLHFCHPVTERPLVEIIETQHTSPETTKRVFDYAYGLGKCPLRVLDSPGFLLNRLLATYLNEALDLLLEGVEPVFLVQAAKEFGMPMGPLKHLDEFGLDVALAVGGTLYAAFPDRIAPSELIIAMYKAKRLGTKAGGGFYSPAADGNETMLDPLAIEIIQKRRRSTETPSPETATRRLWLPMLLEATRICDEGIINSPQDVDTALRDGLAMSPQSQGLLGWADSIGARTILEWLRPLESLGKRFEPTPRLKRIAAANESFLS